MPLRHLAKVRGTLNQVNGLFQIADGMSAGTSPMITIREAFRVELGIQAWKGAIALHVFYPYWSACSATRDQIMEIISRAHGPVMVIFQFSRRRRSTAEAGFFAAVEKSRKGPRLRRAPVLLPRVRSRALPCSSFTSTVTNNNSDIRVNGQSCDNDNKGSSIGISYASGGNTTKGLISQGVQRQGRKIQELPMPQRLKSQGFKSQGGEKSKGPGPRESGDDTPKEIAGYGIKSQGHNSRGRLMPEGCKPPEFIQASSGDNSGGIKFPGLKFQEVDSQEFVQSQGDSHYPKGCKSQEFSEEPGGVSSDSSGFKSLALAQEPGGSNAKGIFFQGCSRDNQEVECNVLGKSNACFVAVSGEKEGAWGFSNIKMALPRAMILILLCLQKICMLISIKVKNAALMVWHFLRNICKPIGNLLIKGGAVTYSTEQKEKENTGVKTTLSERAPINTEDVQSEQNEDINEVNGEQQNPEKDGSVREGAAFRIQLADLLDSKSYTVTHHMCVIEGLTVKLPTNVQDYLADPGASSCILKCQADSCTANTSQNDQGNRTNKEEIDGTKETQDNFAVLSTFNERNEKVNADDHLGGFNPQGIKPMKFTKVPEGNGPSEKVSAGLNQAQGGSNVREIKFPSLKGGNCEEDDVCGTSNLYSVVVTDDKRALCLSRFKMAWLRAIILMLHLSQINSMPNSNVLNKAFSVESEEVQKAEVKKTFSEKGPINTKDVHSEQGDAVDTSLKEKEKDLKNHGTDGFMASGPHYYQSNNKPKKEIDDNSEIVTFDESDDDGEFESEPVVDHLEIEDEDQLDMVLEDGKDLPHDRFNIENPAPFINLPPYNPLEHIPSFDQVPDAHNILPAWLLANVPAQAQAPPAQPRGPNEEAPVNANLAQGHHENPLDDDDEEVDDKAEGPENGGVNDNVPGDVACGSSSILACQEDGCKTSSLRNDQGNKTTKVKSDGTKESQDNFAVLSTFYKRNEEDNEDDYPGGFNPQGIKSMKFTQAPDGDAPSEKVSAGLHQAQGGSNVREITFPSLNRGNCEEDDVCGTSNLYSVVVTDDKRALCLSRFKMAWLRAITLMLHLSQNNSMPNSNELNKAGTVALSVDSEEVHKAGVKKTLNEKGPTNTKDVHSEQGDAVDTSLKGKEKDLKNHGIDGSMASGPQLYHGNSNPNKEIDETTGLQDSSDGLAVFVESDDDEDYESEPVVDHLEIEDEDQLDIVLEYGQDLPHDVFIIENPAPVINLPPYNPLGHIPPFDQVPDAHNIFPAWLLAYQPHLANVQAQAQAPPAQPRGPNEEAPVDTKPAREDHENPLDDDDEEVDDEAEGPENGGVNDNVPGDVARASSCILASQADSCMASCLQNDQGNKTTEEKSDETKESQDNFAVLSTFNERNEEDNEEDCLGGFNPQGIMNSPMKFTQAPDGDAPSDKVSAGLHQAQGGSNVREIKFPSLNGGICEVEDDVCSTSNMYSVVVTDDKRALCLSRFKMAWLRAITLMLHLSQENSTPNSNELNKAGKVALSVDSEEVHKAGVKKTLNEKGPTNTKGVHSEQGDAVDTSLKGKEKDLKNHGIDGFMASGPQLYHGNSTPNKEIDETTGIQDSSDGLAVFVESDDDEDYESEPVVDHLEIEDEDQLDMVLEDGQDLPHDGFNIENPAPVINLPPYNPLEHIPPLDQVPDAHNILPAWLLAYQAHLANVQAQPQAQVQAPPAQLPGPNEEAPVNANPAQGHHENPLDDDDEEVDDEAEGPENGGVNDNAPGVVAAEPPPPPPPVPPPQQPHPNGPRSRLLAVARYLKKKLTRSNHHHVHPMYYPGAPWEEHPPLGLDEAPAFPGGLLLIQPEAEDGEEEERRPRWFSRCFGFLYRHQSPAVQEYPLQGDEAPEFEEAVEVVEAQEEIHDEIVEEGEVAEQIDEDEEPPQALQEFQDPIAVI